MKIFGLLGHPLTHSFSRGYFMNKFSNEHIDAEYLNFDLPDLNSFPELFDSYPELIGMNVTIPYKEKVIRFLDHLDPGAREIGAVNVIKVENRDGMRCLVGYNSDVVGFENSIKPLLNSSHQHALVLGTGGASKAVVYALHKLGITTQYVSRYPAEGVLSYEMLTPEIIRRHSVIVNTTPLGMFPHVNEKPSFPYEGITALHICFDLIYNPAETAFLRTAKEYGACIKNGAEMLEGQAVEAWRIWNQD
ncbi:MAG: shikimate dehydrogenase [Bacteroidales bacterium]